MKEQFLCKEVLFFALLKMNGDSRTMLIRFRRMTAGLADRQDLLVSPAVELPLK